MVGEEAGKGRKDGVWQDVWGWRGLTLCGRVFEPAVLGPKVSGRGGEIKKPQRRRGKREETQATANI